MGLRIGQTGTDLNALRAAAEDRASIAERPVPSEPANTAQPDTDGGAIQANNVTQNNLLDTNEANTFARAERIAPVAAGFGDNTLSAQGAALVTVDVNLRRARDIVPTVQEFDQASREVRREENFARAGNETPSAPAQEAATITPGAETTRRVERFRPEAAPQVRNFAQPEETATARSIGAQAPRVEPAEVPSPTIEAPQAPTPPRVGPGLTEPGGAVTTNQLDILI